VVKNAMVIAMEPFLRMATMTAHFMERPVQLRVADAVASDPSAQHVLSVAYDPSEQHVLSVANAPNVVTSDLNSAADEFNR
jgi:hypothetical protein